MACSPGPKRGDEAVTLQVDLFWSFRSPYCYLAGDRLAALAADHVDFRQVSTPVQDLTELVKGAKP